MKKKILATLMVFCLCAVCITIGACAATSITKISAELRPDITVLIDGQKQIFKNANGDIVDPVLYNGTTYLPIRAIGEIMGKSVSWDASTNKIELKSENQTSVADINNTSDNTSAGGSLSGNTTQVTAIPLDISEEQAKEIALQKAGLTASEVRFGKVNLDNEHGVFVYDIEFYQGNTEYSAEVSVSDGQIVSWKVENEGNLLNNVPQQQNNTGSNQQISEEQAKEIALQKAGLTASEVRFGKIELDNEHGNLVYEIEFYKGNIEYSAEISASDGQIISWDMDRD